MFKPWKPYCITRQQIHPTIVARTCTLASSPLAYLDNQIRQPLIQICHALHCSCCCQVFTHVLRVLKLRKVVFNKRIIKLQASTPSMLSNVYGSAFLL